MTSKDMRFDRYDFKQACKVGNAFLDAFRREFREHGEKLNMLGDRHTPAWTEVVKDWFAATATTADRTLVDASPSRVKMLGRGHIDIPEEIHGIANRPRDTHGEFLFDLTHSRFPPYKGSHKYGTVGWWKDALKSDEPPELLLALESEFGKASSNGGNFAAIMEDASKLLVASARIKVVVYGSRDGDNTREILEIAQLMVQRDSSRTAADKATEDNSPVWLWLDLPWQEWNEEGVAPRGHISTEGSDKFLPLEQALGSL